MALFLKKPIISKEEIAGMKTIAETFNNFFVNIVPSLKILPEANYEVEIGNDDEPILNYIDKLEMIIAHKT